MKKIVCILILILSLVMSCRSDKKSEKHDREKIEQQVISKNTQKPHQKPIKEPEDISDEKSKVVSKVVPKEAKELKKVPKDDEAVTNKIGVIDSGNNEDGEVIHYKSEQGENIKVIFRTYDNKRNYIVVKRSRKPLLKLDQVEAWAKGAIYEKDSVRMEFDFEKATLEIGDKIIKCTGDKEISN